MSKQLRTTIDAHDALHPDVVEAHRALGRISRERRPDDPLVEPFLVRYYGELTDFDLDGRTLDHVFDAGVAHLDLGRRRQPGETLVEAVVDVGHCRERSRALLLVVTDDAPFMVDTIRLELDRRGLAVHLLVHPMLHAERDDDGVLVGVGGGAIEAWTQVEIDACPPEELADLVAEIRRLVDQVHLVVRDFDPMRARMREVGVDEPLLTWLAAEHFVFLGAASYDTTDDGLRVAEGSQLGVLREPHPIDPPASDVVADTVPVIVVARTDAVSRLHRRARQTCVTVVEPSGRRHRFVGLLASGAYRQSVLSIPSVGARARAVLGLAEEGAESHTGRSMRNVLETLPRDVVFELGTDALAQLVIDIVGLQERSIVRIFDVPEPVGQLSTLLVYLPRSRFHSRLPDEVAAIVADAYGGPVRDLESSVGTSSLARITMTVRRPASPPDLGDLTARIDDRTLSWVDRVRELADARRRDRALSDARSRDVGRLAAITPRRYQASTPPEQAVVDLDRIAAMLDSDQALATSIDPTTVVADERGDAVARWRFRVYRVDESVALADLLPLLDHLGLRAIDERPSEIDVDERRVFVYDIGVDLPPGSGEPDAATLHELRRTFEDLVRGDVEADDLNRLVLAAGLDRREIAVLRLYVRYLQQIGFTFSPAYIERTLVRRHELARALADLFTARFDPDVEGSRSIVVAAARECVSELLDRIDVLDDDRICRAISALIEATTRTNRFRDGHGRTTLSVKLDPGRIPDVPEPRPMFEIFVSSPRVEGVHLRGGPIARGGLRWSDRREDFRTEVLGLVKAQMVKNAVIVPVGAKGGFVVKRPPDDPTQLRTAGVACYREFIGALLDLTDNIVDGAVVHPPSTVVYDDDDPYFVVAADKGTATFSDIANEVAESYDFWLGDAFASGGSAGYDHKAMGITARGAWESVRRHAHALGLDADADRLTAVGIGDMSGDVFGNGMLISSNLELVAAFDHRDIFIDPDPDPAASHAERRRLFELPRSSWKDYDTSVISEGGGVYPRSVKAIELSARAREVLGITATGPLTPPELIRAILLAPVDLLWNGGIGTYVKASSESHADVGDRVNDAIRVDGAELRCRIVGEGGNLGLTQLGRVEFALNGGLVNTDAIDNSAGVDCSDHEVNIKVLLQDAVRSGALDRDDRDALLAEMTDEVADLVLANNQAQTLALAIARRQAYPMVNVHARYLDVLEAEGWLDRDIEFLPSDKQIAERQAAGQGLQTPEFAVLIAYTKNADVAEILATDLPDHPALRRDLVDYFPTALRERFGDQIDRHRLRREIVATSLVNQMVNLSGISFDHRMTEDTGAGVADVARAWLATREILDFDHTWAHAEELRSDLDLDTWLEVLLDCRRMAERCSLWLLRHRRPPLDVSSAIDRFTTPVRHLSARFDSIVQGPMGESITRVERQRREAGVPGALARSSSWWRLMHTAFDQAEVATRHDLDIVEVAGVYWELFEVLDLMWLWEGVGSLSRADRWQTQARSAARDDLMSSLADLTELVIVDGGSVAEWVATNERPVTRSLTMFNELRRAENQDVTTVTVALRQLRNLTVSSLGSTNVTAPWR